jgi:hypothetical protein
MGAPANARWAKCPRVDDRRVTSLSSQPSLELVSSVPLGTCACVTGISMTYLSGALQVPLSSPIAGAIVHVAVGSSSSDDGGVEPPSKRAHPWSFLLASTRYVCGAKFHGMSFPLPTFWIPCFEGTIRLNDRSHTILVSVVHRQSAVAVAVVGIGGAPQGIVGTKMSGASVSRSAAPGGAGSTPGLSHPKIPNFRM